MTSQVTGTILPLREVGEKRLNDYGKVAGVETLEEIRSLAAPLFGKRVLHINSSPFGGGVADILEALVPLLNNIGLQAEWRTIRGNAAFFDITKKMHNSLQGKSVTWTRAMWNTWLEWNERNAREVYPDYDLIIVHDPQPAALLHFLELRDGRGAAKWLWRCHLDLTDSPSDVWNELSAYVQPYDAVQFSLAEFVKNGLRAPQTFIFPPAIDPLNPKNIPLRGKMSREVLKAFDVDVERPIMAQISRFDPWKDPLGVIDAYRLARTRVEGLQLVMMGPIAADDPEGWSYFELSARRAGEDPDIYLLTNFKGVDDLAVNALQTLAKVVVQKSIREGFGLSVTGSLWHRKPVIAGRAGGITLQVIDGETGYLIDDTEECAEMAVKLLQSPTLSRCMGQKAREHVRKNFLITRYLRDSLQMYGQILNGAP